MQSNVKRRGARAAQQNSPQQRRETALYIANMCGELAALAGRERMSTLTYFLNMSRVEAEMAALASRERA
ncbi:MAG: hypothetical protein KGL46_09070 [Hyphomicrobiales bacterium]|nr:hypothetical protein [Hyphomicrobiales bacterium]